jgi:hypothetical protein
MKRKRPSIPVAAWRRRRASKIVSHVLRVQGEERPAKAAPMIRGLWPSEAAVAKILDDTGREFVPPGLDPNALRADLNQCRREILAKQVDTAAYRKSYEKAAARTGKQAAALRALLKNSGNRLFDQELWFTFDHGEYDLVLALTSKIELEAKRIADAGIVAQDAAGGPKEYLVELLKPIYECHFGRTAGRDHEYDGPFPQFAAAVGREMSCKLRVSKHTVHKSLAKISACKKLPRTT